jgi:hypothetical protein
MSRRTFIGRSFFVAITLGVLAATTLSNRARADFLQPAGWTPGDFQSTYQAWNNFTNTTAAAPDAGYSVNPSGLNSPAMSATGAIVTGSQNYYSFAADYSATAKIFNYGGASGSGGLDPSLGTHVIVQNMASTYSDIGVYPDSLQLVGLNGESLLGGTDALQSIVTWQGVIDSPLGPASTEQRLWEFFLPNYSGDFKAIWNEKIHSSLMEVRIDTMLAENAFPLTSVPEPGTGMMLGSSLLICLGAFRLLHFNRHHSKNRKEVS